MWLRKFRERINLYIYDSKDNVLGLMKWLHIFVSLGVIGVIIYYYGFPQTKYSEIQLVNLIQYSFMFYIARYFIRFFYDFNPLEFIKNNLFEGIVILILLAEGIAFNVYGNLLLSMFFESIGLHVIAHLSRIFIQCFFVFYIISDFAKNQSFRPWAKIHPGLLFVISIGTIVFIGTFLLMLPEMTTSASGIKFIDSLFVATSATSSTGLTTVDLSELFTVKGQVIILALIKIGGLNTIVFGVLYLLVAKLGVGIKHHELMEDFINKDSILKTGSVFGEIILWGTTIELLGALFLFMLSEPTGIYQDTETHLFHSLFHAISGFNNAGLSILPNGMMNTLIVDNYLYHIVLATLIFLGGFGMVYLFDMFSIKRLRERMDIPWKTLEFGTKISLYFTLGLLVFGAVLFFVLERDNTLAGKGVFGSFVSSIFQSATTRNAGFNTVDISQLTLPVCALFLFLMFVGASSGSTGGGIRTSSFAIICASVISTIKGKRNVELFKRTIANDVVMKAYSVMMFFILINMVGSFILAITEHEALEAGQFNFIDVIIEHVSAVSTVGLTRGITSTLTFGGKVELIFAMFIGRVGTLTIAYLFGKEVISKSYKYPLGHTMVG